MFTSRSPPRLKLMRWTLTNMLLCESMLLFNFLNILYFIILRVVRPVPNFNMHVNETNCMHNTEWILRHIYLPSLKIESLLPHACYCISYQEWNKFIYHIINRIQNIVATVKRSCEMLISIQWEIFGLRINFSKSISELALAWQIAFKEHYVNITLSSLRNGNS